MTDQRVKTDTNGSTSTEPTSVPDNQTSTNVDETTSSKLPTDSQSVIADDHTVKVSSRTISESLRRKRADSNLTDIDASNATIPIDLNAVSASGGVKDVLTVDVTNSGNETEHERPNWAEGLLDGSGFPAESQTIDEQSSGSSLEPSSDQIDVTSLPQSTQSLIANVEMETPSEARITRESQSTMRPLLGSFILLGGYGEEREGIFEFEHVLEVRKIAAPRRGLLRRGLFIGRNENYTNLFLEEAEVARQIVHPNVTRVYHVGRQNSFPYLVREHVPGVTLAEQILNQPKNDISFSQFASIFIQVIDGLNAVHELRNATGESLQMVHAAINPNSILLGSTGRVRITEPVFSKLNGRLLESQEITRQQIDDYQPPELQDARTVSAMGDWYSLAIAMIEFLGSASAVKAVVSNRSSESVKSALFDISLIGQHDQLFTCLLGLITEAQEHRFDWAQQLRTILNEELNGAKPHSIVAALLRKTASEPEVKPVKDTTQPIRKVSEVGRQEAKDALSGEISYRRGTTELSQESVEPQSNSRLILPAYLMIALGLVGALIGMFLLNWLID